MLKLSQTIVTRSIKVGTKGYVPSATTKDGFYQYKGTKLIAHDSQEVLKDGRHAGKDATLEAAAASDEYTLDVLIEWDKQTVARYGKGIIYMANYGIDLAERSLIDSGVKENTGKAATLATLQKEAENWMAELDFEQLKEIVGLIKAGKKLTDLYVAQRDNTDLDQQHVDLTEDEPTDEQA